MNTFTNENDRAEECKTHKHTHIHIYGRRHRGHKAKQEKKVQFFSEYQITGILYENSEKITIAHIGLENNG